MIKINFLKTENNLKEKINTIILKKFYFEDIEIGFYKLKEIINSSQEEFQKIIQLFLKYKDYTFIENVDDDNLINILSHKKQNFYENYIRVLINKKLLAKFFEVKDLEILDLLIKYNSEKINAQELLNLSININKDYLKNILKDDNILFVIINDILRNYLNLNLKSEEELCKEIYEKKPN